MKKVAIVLLMLFSLGGCALGMSAEANRQARAKAAREDTERRWAARAANVEDRHAATLARLAAERTADENAREPKPGPAPVKVSQPATATTDGARLGATVTHVPDKKAQEPKPRPAPVLTDQPEVAIASKASVASPVTPEPIVEVDDTAFRIAYGAKAWEPGGFRGIPWGASRSAIRRKIPGIRDLADSCGGEFKIGQVPANLFFLFGSDGGMDYALFSFASEDFADMKAAFVERYGLPTSRATPTVRNGFGVELQNDVLKWSGNKVVIFLGKYGSKVTESLGSVATVEGMRLHIGEGEDLVRVGKKDL